VTAREGVRGPRFGAGLLRTLFDAVRAHEPTGVLIVADEAIAGRIPLPDAPRLALRAEKTFDAWRRVLDACVGHGLDREGIVVACGGGTVLDVAGFAAATYLRGVRWIAVPTTLLAQVDAAHGGKTAIDHDAAKNLVGAFHAPVEVVCDTDFLETLPGAEVRAGLAEVVKHAVIGAPGLLGRVGRDDPASFVEEAAGVKLAIVARDPFERGERRALNLGHTLGHALERASGYALSHGDAVAVGLRAACAIAARHCGFCDAALVEEALDRSGLPARADVDPGAVRAALRHDKKRRADRLAWVLPVELGRVEVYLDVPEELVWDISRPLCSS